eukprot:TRINITY_DN4205_c1_g1_i6.p1 TRINITY_DN4205_c1_g1~~TRINITY_DN4205_c1_g1_i6.p1  ORF type:complete len:404 (-),score=73.27 TRINITY_DN4205_c1_g1_i6:85-1236(-)
MASSSFGVQEEILKTRMCSFHLAGRCNKGSTCTFAHHESELRPKLNLFKSRPCAAYVRKGHCNEGDACRFAHGASDLRVPLLTEDAGNSLACSDDGSEAPPARGASNKKTRQRQPQQQPPVPAMDSSHLLASALSMHMPQALPANTRVLAIMMPPQPVFAASSQAATQPFAAAHFPSAPQWPFQFGMMPQPVGPVYGTSADPAQGPENKTKETLCAKPEVHHAHATEVPELSKSPVLPNVALSASNEAAKAAKDQNKEAFSVNGRTPATATSSHGFEGELLHGERKRHDLDDEESVASLSESEGHECFSPRSNFDFGVRTPTSSCDYEVRTVLPAEDDFWLRLDLGANRVYEKHTFLHVAPAVPTASRRSRSSPCGNTSNVAL